MSKPDKQWFCPVCGSREAPILRVVERALKSIATKIVDGVISYNKSDLLNTEFTIIRSREVRCTGCHIIVPEKDVVIKELEDVK